MVKKHTRFNMIKGTPRLESVSNVKMLGINIETNEHEFFDLRDVKEIKRMPTKSKSKEVLVYITSYGSFTPITTLEEAEAAYNQFGFKSCDQSHLINKRKVKKTIIESHGIRVIFDDGSETNVALKSRKR